MNIVYGLVLIVAAVGMTWVARPAPGHASAPFLKGWMLGEFYAMAVLICGVTGVCFLLLPWLAGT